MLLEGPGGWGGAQQGPRAGVGRGRGGALGLVKPRRSQACPRVWKAGPGGLQCPRAATMPRAWPGDPRTRCLTQIAAGGGCDQGNLSSTLPSQSHTKPSPVGHWGWGWGSLTEGRGFRSLPPGTPVRETHGFYLEDGFLWTALEGLPEVLSGL